jgi:hypothetical protein
MSQNDSGKGEQGGCQGARIVCAVLLYFITPLNMLLPLPLPLLLLHITGAAALRCQEP